MVPNSDGFIRKNSDWLEGIDQFGSKPSLCIFGPYISDLHRRVL